MSEDFGSDFITISDEDGNDYTLEHFDTIELNDTYYMAFLPADLEEDSEDFGFVILEAIGDEELATIDDEELLEKLYNMFVERLLDDEALDETDEELEELD